jgi:hypothetical protein
MKAIMTAIAPSYSEGTRTFAVGDFCMYESQLYRCTTAVVTPEPFNILKWIKIDAVSELMDEIYPPVQSSQPAGGLAPNVKYRLGVLTGTVSFALAAATDANIPNVYWINFDTGSTAPTISWPLNVVWPKGTTAPVVGANEHYEVKVEDGYITYNVFDIPSE